MLYLQRASAGSGKTYALARRYIFNLISIAGDDGRQRLRTAAEIDDAVPRILAITFTNKATAEMKQRIVARLADLAVPVPGMEPDYLGYFMSELGETEERVRHACADALAALLTRYSDFSVSTIDSFFQTVLRTFAYEAELNDSYQVELDSDFISRVGIDATLEHIDTGTALPEELYWVEKLMGETAGDGGSWNVFTRSDGRQTLYATLNSMARRLQKEDFKRNRSALLRYFDEAGDFRDRFERIDRTVKAPVLTAYHAMKSAAKAVQRALGDVHADPAADCLRYFGGHLQKVLAHSRPFRDINASMSKMPAAVAAKGLLRSGRDGRLDTLALDFYASVERWREAAGAEDVRLWQLYRPGMVYLGLLRFIMNNSRRFLEDNNLVELAETNSLLQRIIGDDETPFIYERIGSVIDHYLIDEFQDTSAMQWSNLRPLLRESEGRGNANLIIGDAKQSIYRFRNADASLITTVVPGEFPLHAARGLSPDENTNHRSCRRVVEFNNYLFSRLADALADSRPCSPVDFRDLYANVVQPARHRRPEGYVELNMVPKADAGAVPEHFAALGTLVMSMVDRGYRMRDIAFLVNTKEKARMLIDELMRYNSSRPAGARRIEFVSEESLLVSGAMSVRIIVSALEMMVRGNDFSIREGEDAVRRGVVDVSRMACNYNFFALNHPDLPPDVCVRMFLEESDRGRPVDALLATMHSVALPALVEAVVDSFVPAGMRSREAVYMAAFQDAVLDYCESHPSDVGSFLRWWEHQSRTLAVTSPEGSDAVSIMTIHKSKGLEFECVVIPYADFNFGPRSMQTEWLWLPPGIGSLPEGCGLPPVVPVDSVPQLADTCHAADYEAYAASEAMDNINKAYVAFTRAVRELYVYIPSGALAGRRADAPSAFCNVVAAALPPGRVPENDMADMPPAGSFEITAGAAALPVRVRYGEPAESFVPGAGVSSEPEIIDSYYVNTGSDLLRYKEVDIDTAVDLDDEDADPRSVGKMMHLALSMVREAADLPAAVRRLRIRGLVTAESARQVEAELSAAMSRPEVRGWFDGSWRVCNERPLLRAHCGLWRPDRIMADKDGNAVVVDYKFGSVKDDGYRRSHARYASQVSRYIAGLRSTGLFGSVRGYIWYVRRDEVSPVDL